jgi:hypothetical protein
MRYAHIEEETGRLLGWYSHDVHGDNIPTPNVEVEESVWQSAININANCYEEDLFIVKDFRTQAEIDQQIQDDINSEALAYLASTDWYVIREQETGVVTPEDIKTARAEARERIKK